MSNDLNTRWLKACWLKDNVRDICQSSREAAHRRQQQLSKPPGSLGRLEELAIDFAGFQKTAKPELNQVAIRIFAGDHGVVEEGVSAFPQAVTGEMIRNFAAGGAAITVLARQCEADFSVINLGTVNPVEALENVDNLQIANGTDNFCKAPAMSEQQLAIALQAGRDSIPEGCQLFVGGEMGIGNTTSAAAIYCGLLPFNVDDITGRGTGIDDVGLGRKRRAVRRGLQLHAAKGSPAEEILRCLGGFEIAALVGAYIGCAQRGIPSLVDGYIATAAALVATRINPGVKEWLLFSHCSAESSHRQVLGILEARPLLDFGMSLGEGSGAALAVLVVQSALKLHAEMATFAEAGVSGQ